MLEERKDGRVYCQAQKNFCGQLKKLPCHTRAPPATNGPKQNQLIHEQNPGRWSCRAEVSEVSMRLGCSTGHGCRGCSAPQRSLTRITAGVHLWLVTANTVSPRMLLAQPPTSCGRIPLVTIDSGKRAFNFYSALVQTLGGEILGRTSEQTKLGSGTLWSSI